MHPVTVEKFSKVKNEAPVCNAECTENFLQIVNLILFQSQLPCKRTTNILIKKGKAAILVTGREGPEGCETSRLPHFLDSRLTYGGNVVSLTHWPPFTPRKILIYSYSF
jgi:hypothetical protein